MQTDLRLTWLIHDVTPWRIDAVTVHGADVWVETTMSIDGSTDLFTAPSVRHRATDAALLLRTLRSLGVLDGARPVVAVPSGSTGPAAAAPVAGGTVTPSTGLSWAGTVGAAGLALAVGVVTGLVAGPRLRRPSPSGRT